MKPDSSWSCAVARQETINIWFNMGNYTQEEKDSPLE